MENIILLAPMPAGLFSAFNKTACNKQETFDTYKVTLANRDDAVELDVGCTLQIEDIDRDTGQMTVSRVDQSVDKHCPPGKAHVINSDPGCMPGEAFFGCLEPYSTVNRLTYNLLGFPSPDAYEYVIKTYPSYTGRITIPEATSNPSTTGATCSSCGTHNEYAEGGAQWKCYGCRNGT